MNLEQVSHYIAHPQELGLNEAPALKELSAKHPYAAVFSLLYLTALANGKSVDLDAALKQHAYRLSDRTKLYHLVHNSGTEPENTSVSAAAEELRTEPEPVETEPETTSLSTVTDELRTDDSDEDQTVSETLTEPETIEPDPISLLEEGLREVTQPQITDSEPEPEEETEAKTETISIEPANFGLITEAFTREQHFDISTGDSVPTEIAEETVVPEHISDEEPATTETEEVTEPVKEEQEASDSESPMPPSSPDSYPDPQGRKPETEPAPSSRSFTSWLNSSAETDEKPEISSVEPAIIPERKKVDDIIESFIKEEPSITRGKAEFFSPSKKAKESLDEDAVPVSETLAKIYAAQGNYPKAIHVYHQLMLSFPEKKSLFAVQIEALKKKITS